MMIFLAAMIFIMGVLYSYFSDIQRKQLKSETQLAAQGTALSGLTYLQTLSADCRITWIAADGTVRYDSDADADAMENHLARAEVQEALRSGYGESTRYSGTLAQQLIYAAQRLPDGSVIRLARSRRTAWFLLIGFLQPICAVILLALILTFLTYDVSNAPVIVSTVLFAGIMAVRGVAGRVLVSRRRKRDAQKSQEPKKELYRETYDDF